MTYKARRNALAGALTEAFGPKARLSGLHTGLHLLLHFGRAGALRPGAGPGGPAGRPSAWPP